MIQEIITYIIVAYAFGYTLKGIYNLTKVSNTGCAESSCNCGDKSILFKEIKKGKKPFLLN